MLENGILWSRNWFCNTYLRRRHLHVNGVGISPASRIRNNQRDKYVPWRKDMENIEKADAIEIDKIEKVTGGDDLKGKRLAKYRCERCGQTYALSKEPKGMTCLVCGGKLVFVCIE